MFDTRQGLSFETKFFGGVITFVVVFIIVIVTISWKIVFLPQFESVNRDLTTAGCSQIEDAIGQGMEMNKSLATWQAWGFGDDMKPIQIPECE